MKVDLALYAALLLSLASGSERVEDMKPMTAESKPGELVQVSLKIGDFQVKSVRKAPIPVDSTSSPSQSDKGTDGIKSDSANSDGETGSAGTAKDGAGGAQNRTSPGNNVAEQATGQSGPQPPKGEAERVQQMSVNILKSALSYVAGILG